MGARVIENWADVTGLVLETRPGQSEEFLELDLQIEAAADVEGVANLVAPLVGKTLWVNMRYEMVQSLHVGVGDVVQARVRRLTAELAFVHSEYVAVHRVRTTASSTDAELLPAPDEPMPEAKSRDSIPEPAPEDSPGATTKGKQDDAAEAPDEHAESHRKPTTSHRKSHRKPE
ncbi:MAG: hypothetical protein KDE54_21560 [Caldilineaceae bacterium]|nr:hypothetical protein [Caldilineaceae bacterium]MCB0097551.1 hypothetical protein [Caldilineaceae bacterium]MCB0143779.1 hypothetical protein [Caldilineaceae bacterium]